MHWRYCILAPNQYYLPLRDCEEGSYMFYIRLPAGHQHWYSSLLTLFSIAQFVAVVSMGFNTDVCKNTLHLFNLFEVACHKSTWFFGKTAIFLVCYAYISIFEHTWRYLFFIMWNVWPWLMGFRSVKLCARATEDIRSTSVEEAKYCDFTFQPSLPGCQCLDMVDVAMFRGHINAAEFIVNWINIEDL